MAKIRITRSNEFINWARNFRIYSNGQKIGTISSGETKEFELNAGTHSICAKIDWCGSHDLPITLKDDEIKHITIKGFKYAGIIMFITSISSIFVLTFGHYLKTYYSFFVIPLVAIASIFMVTLLYYLTIGRKRYLTITEVKE